jgi:non-specific serine/threonine protein kinase
MLMRERWKVLKEFQKIPENAVNRRQEPGDRVAAAARSVQKGRLVTTVYDLGPFRLDADAGVLMHDGDPLPLGPRAIAVLTVLVENAQVYLPKERILEAAWPGLVVEEGNLAVQVSAIRRTLARAPETEGWIETLPRRGYRFAGPVSKDTGHEIGAKSRGGSAKVPRSLASFVGRERELAEIGGLLSSSPLVTLVGAGGIGKTRLAIQVATQFACGYPDGVYFVDLAGLTDERLVPEAVALALGVHQVDDPVTELLKYFDGRALLLVLDNCEHLLRGCATLTKALLQSSDRAKVLATSREGLHLIGEVTFTVPPLPVPEVQNLRDVPHLLHYPAVRLFRDRATAAQPHFEIDAQNAAAVVDICRWLEGIPLAIEMAAARVKFLLPEKIAERLHDRFRLLQIADTATSSRQNALRTSIDWSYALLTQAERCVLRRLAVFAGNWTLEAAEAVVAEGEVPPCDVLSIVGSLVEKSMVQFDHRTGRYRLLETVRLYALEHLVDLGEERTTRLRHLDFYLGLAEGRDPTGPAAQQRWLTSIDSDHDNALAAHEFCCQERPGGMRGLRLAAAMFPYWFHRGLLGVGYRVTFEALAADSAKAPSEARFRALFAAGLMGRSLGHHEEAPAFIEESISVANALHDDRRLALSLSLRRNRCAIFSLAGF